MAIQFFCTACGQPIEVDDNMANLAVTCPYCHKPVIAPAQSDLTTRPQPTAPLPGPGEFQVPAVRSTTPPTGPMGPAAVLPSALAPLRPRTIAGWLSLGCMVLAIGITVYGSMATAMLIQDLHPESLKPDQQAEFQGKIAERFQAHPILAFTLLLGVCLLPVAAVILAVAALVAGGRPRWPAITTLAILGLGIVFSCAGLVIQRSAMQGGP